MRIIVASLAASALVLSLAGCAASLSNSLEERGIEGTWVGSNVGYESGEYQDREVRLIIDQSTGTTFSGEKAWREVDGEWSDPEPFAGNIVDSTEFHATDFDGYIIGKVVSSTSIQATYLESGEDSGAFALDLEKVTE
ncbi:hypothetical protein FHX49_001714 [Microbacterium endophyticum]|uniref:Lipoprotein n=1 Tax=Microbacterium endophyticum TaxID=1526412 RepID=A0A7W4V430_9MICO|nr:hypothetical protein [Microbacterium endophyticum]MBB2976144.1 hypothetical protein [Microbacterium endophyticum]NIK36441.1 hypothetical protein [Microbacterium endophyticum]